MSLAWWDVLAMLSPHAQKMMATRREPKWNKCKTKVSRVCDYGWRTHAGGASILHATSFDEIDVRCKKRKKINDTMGSIHLRSFTFFAVLACVSPFFFFFFFRRLPFILGAQTAAPDFAHGNRMSLSHHSHIVCVVEVAVGDNDGVSGVGSSTGYRLLSVGGKH